jgi:hypothetical protein
MTSIYRMDDLFGITESAKAIGDEETANPRTEIHEKETSHVQEITTGPDVRKGATESDATVEHTEIRI